MRDTTGRFIVFDSEELEPTREPRSDGRRKGKARLAAGKQMRAICSMLGAISKVLKTYTAECTDYLFINKNGDELTRSGVRTRINKLVSQATAQVPSLREKTVTLHTF